MPRALIGGANLYTYVHDHDDVGTERPHPQLHPLFLVKSHRFKLAPCVTACRLLVDTPTHVPPVVRRTWRIRALPVPTRR